MKFMTKRIMTIALMAALAVSANAQLEVYRNGNVTIGLTEQSRSSKLSVGGTVTAHGLIIPSPVVEDGALLKEGGLSGVLSTIMAMDVVSYEEENYDESDNAEPAPMQFVLSAKTLQMLCPSLVVQDSEGVLGINYTGLIPLLVRSIQELKQEVESLKASLSSQSSQYDSNTTSKDSRFTAMLSQNNPNPVREQTTINYSLSGTFSNASITIADIYGNIVKSYSIQQGSGSITVRAAELGTGVYIYSLVVDNTVAESRKMVVTK